jgi:hypothetical protein
MIELHVATSNALRGALVPVVQMSVKEMPTYPRPWYFPEVPPQTVGEYRAALAKLGKLGLVREN